MMSPKRLLLLAASVVAALDADAPASLVSDCTVPASAYAIRACAAERLNLAHGDPALRPLPEEESMRGVISAARGPRSACVECLSAIDAIAGRRRRLAPRGDRAVYNDTQYHYDPRPPNRRRHRNARRQRHPPVAPKHRPQG